MRNFNFCSTIVFKIKISEYTTFTVLQLILNALYFENKNNLKSYPMKTLLLFAFSILFSQFAAMSQGYLFFNAPDSETIQKNAIMPAETGVYFAMQKSVSSSSLYWLKNNVLTEVTFLFGSNVNIAGMIK